ncbi:MAG: hypothetical protein A3B23_01030 [Candidatus Colwellbacteria bacterium RIFCSPLOWO2_01_FULL_48_10]|uniref:Uncharacterized protein n=2 Tax=Bacteria candidate phyla TaxID=1783234 RepID=A0A1F5P2L5_9BACT|nr:MAG: hypothetical protein A2846_04070 [Candidatus Doudnabacteria bacterium RIFCSPHIGHO2_01_FULL_49_9]OGY59526.1 MAG: hypothetical protein A3B23_01030 [Candidatus Colwellbacteria bacterium RIFCSPLOWO2_01_FULL_48_10]
MNKVIMFAVVGLLVGVGAGYFLGVNREKAAAAARQAEIEQEAASLANPFQNSSANPFESSLNPFEEVKTNPFAQ